MEAYVQNSGPKLPVYDKMIGGESANFQLIYQSTFSSSEVLLYSFLGPFGLSSASSAS